MSRRLLWIAVAITFMGVTPLPARATPPGRNGLLIWHREFRDKPPDVWVANPDGSGQRKALSGRRTGEFDATLSPTSPTTAAFTRGGLRGLPFEIYTGDIATGVVRRLTAYRRVAAAPTFSPDGTKIVYFTDKDFPAPRTEESPPPPSEIYVISADGSGQRRLTRDHRDSVDPDWSPDGTQIAYTENRLLPRGRFRSRIVIINADGTGKRAVTAFGTTDANPKWMPDGRRIVFEKIRRRGNRSDIYMINSDGTGLTAVLATPRWETNPVPSPDGSRIVFCSDRDRPGSERLGPGFEIYTMNLDGTGITRITNNRSPDIWPDWQRVP
jgi:Tol biopolymer transport system component